MSCAGCVSRYVDPTVGSPATTVREADRAGNLTGYDELDCDISQDESLATPVSAMTFGNGEGQHWVYLVADAQQPTAVRIDVSTGSESIFDETVQLGGDRYTSFEFAYEAPYTLTVTIGGNQVELAVREEPIGAAPGDEKRVSGQTFCLTTDGEFEEQFWY